MGGSAEEPPCFRITGHAGETRLARTDTINTGTVPVAVIRARRQVAGIALERLVALACASLTLAMAGARHTYP
jgi:hypothetical protein